MEIREGTKLTSHKGTTICTIIIPEDNSAQSAELLSGQYPNSKVITFYDTNIDKTIYGVIIKNEGADKNEY